MNWIAPTEKDTATAVLAKRLWDAVGQFRGNSGLNHSIGTMLEKLDRRFNEKTCECNSLIHLWN